MTVKKKVLRANKTLFRVRDMRTLEAEQAADLKRRNEIDLRMAARQRRLDAMRLLLETEDTPVPSEPVRPRKIVRARPVVKAEPKPVHIKSARRINGSGEVTWPLGIEQVLAEQTQGISHQQLLAEVQEMTALPVSNGAKGFYNAIARLAESGKLVKAGGLLYSAALAKKINESGQPLPVRIVDKGGSTSIVLSVLKDHPEGLTAPEIKDLVSQHPDSPESITKHKHYLYNVLGVLAGRHLITREGGKYRLARTQSIAGVH